MKVFGASYPRIILEGSQSPAILTNDLQEYLKKFKPHAIVLKLGYHDTRVSNAEQFAANLEWLLSMIDEELNADVPFTGRLCSVQWLWSGFNSLLYLKLVCCVIVSVSVTLQQL